AFQAFTPQTIGVADIDKNSIEGLHASRRRSQQGHDSGIAEHFKELPLFVAVAAGAHNCRQGFGTPRKSVPSWARAEVANIEQALRCFGRYHYEFHSARLIAILTLHTAEDGVDPEEVVLDADLGHEVGIWAPSHGHLQILYPPGSIEWVHAHHALL